MKQKLLFLLTALLLLTTSNAWGEVKVLYSQDFNAESGVPTGWTQASGSLTLESSGANKWLRETTAGTGSRTAWYTGTAIKKAIGEYTSYTLEFDCRIKEGTNTTNYAQGVWVLGSNLDQSWGTPTSPAIGLLKASNETTYTIHANAAATAETVNLTSNTWYHYVCAYDHSTKKITFSILSADKSSTIYAANEFDYDYSADGKGVFQSIAFQAGRGSGYTEIDNIIIKANPISATLDHTAGAQWGSNTGVSTVDAAKEHYNNDAANAWAGCAYAKFSYEIPVGHIIKSATLTYSVNQGGSFSRNDIIYYMKKDFDIDWATFAGQTGKDLRNTSNRAGTAVASASTGGTGDRIGLSQNVTSAVKAIHDEGQNYIIFQWTGNAGGADLYGKDADASKRPTLVIETAPEVVAAIDDCKAHETSSDFATYIDGLYDAGSLSTTSDVYSAHTAWQIENASSNEITKVIFDAQVSDFSRWNNARSNQDQQYTGAPDNKYFDAWNNETSDGKQKIYGLPAGTYTLKAATRASNDVTDVNNYKVWVKGGSADESVLGNHNDNTGGELGNGWSWTTLTFTLDAMADVEIGFYSRPPTDRWTGCDDFHLYAAGVSATLGTNGYTTFASPYALDLTAANLPSGLKAYKAQAVNGTSVRFAEFDQTVPANTGILFEGEPGETYNIPVVASGDEVSENLFSVNEGAGYIDPSYDEGTTGVYYFAMIKDSDPLTFGKFNPASYKYPSDKAYLTVAKNAGTRLTVRFDGDDPTAINALEAAEEEDGTLKDGKYLIGTKVVLVKNGVKYSANGQKLN